MRLLLTSLLLWLAATTCHAELPVFTEVEAMHEDARARLAAGKFDGLLADADKYLASRERFADGRWKLAILLGGLHRGFEADAQSPQDWARYETALNALAKKHPESTNAWIFLATLADSHAWALRGIGYSDTVTTEGEIGFKRYLTQARGLLEAHPVQANPAWFNLRISVGGALGESAQDLDRVFAAAIKREPGYQQTWFTRMVYLEPKWGGSLEKMVALVKQGAQNTSPTEGRGMMGRLLWVATETNYPQLMTLPEIEWEAVKASYDDVLKRYPDDWNAQWFFLEACRHSDKDAATRFMEAVKFPASPALLGNNVRLYGLCRDWATGKLPTFIMRDRATGTQKVIQ